MRYRKEMSTMTRTVVVNLNFNDVLSRLDDGQHRPLAVVFYNRKSKSLEFRRAKGVELQDLSASCVSISTPISR